MPELHPVVDRLLNSGRYALRGRSEILTEHQLKDRKGNVTRNVTRADLDAIAKVTNQKAENGALSPLAAGHSFDDVYDEKGQLLRKFPEEKQPQPLGYLYRYSVDQNPHTGKYSLFADEYVQKQITDPETGQMVDGVQYAATFPRRSAEVYYSDNWVDWVAMLRRAPRLDLGLQLYAKNDPDHHFYMRHGSEEAAPVCQMARGKTRYSFDTGGDHMDPAAADPTKPPQATPAASPSAPASPTAPAAAADPMAASPEHQKAAEAYFKHVTGMHPSQGKKLMGHLHQKYAMECGLPSDMNQEYAMAIPGAAAVAPAPAHHTPPSPSATSAPATPPEKTQMQHDQAAIEKERYERRVAALEEGLAQERTARQAAETRELHTQYERQLMQLVYEGFTVDAAAELEFCTKRKYSKEQFDDHIGILRRLPRAPVGSLPPLNDLQRDFRGPANAQPTPTDEMPEQEFAKANRYSRQHPDLTWEQVKERYNKPNGVVAK